MILWWLCTLKIYALKLKYWPLRVYKRPYIHIKFTWNITAWGGGDFDFWLLTFEKFMPQLPPKPFCQKPCTHSKCFWAHFLITAIVYIYWACKTLFRPIKPTNPSVQMAYKGQSSFGIMPVVYTYGPAKPYLGLLNPSIHQSKCPIKVSSFGKLSLHEQLTWNNWKAIELQEIQKSESGTPTEGI